MSTAPGLRTALMVNGIYTTLVGLLLLFPTWAATIFSYPVKDGAVTSGWGTGLITVGVLALVSASDVEKHGALAWAFILGLILSAIDLVYFWATGAYTPRNVLIPIIINVVLAAWLWSGRPRA